jgi:antitoxin component of MazEF toxin-antitoxin module
MEVQKMETEIIEINGELGVVLPEEIMRKLNLSIGADVVLIENANSLTIKPREYKNIID